MIILVSKNNFEHLVLNFVNLKIDMLPAHIEIQMQTKMTMNCQNGKITHSFFDVYRQL